MDVGRSLDGSEMIFSVVWSSSISLASTSSQEIKMDDNGTLDRASFSTSRVNKSRHWFQ